MTNRDREQIDALLRERILLLDGAFGTMIQGYGLAEEDFRGERFSSWGHNLRGCNDCLVLTRPDIITEIHERYLSAGADIISTNSFNANAISLAEYGLAEYAGEIARRSAEIAREAADRFTVLNPHKPRFVAGSVGPTSKTSSIATDVEHPELREVTFEQLAEAYKIQIEGLIDGGADIILIETIFDTLNAKAAIYALHEVSRTRGREIAVMLSGTLADTSGRMLSGQTIEAFYASVVHARPLTVGFNCAYGAAQLLPFLERLSAVSDYPISAHPNAGLPNIEGGYDQSPEQFACEVEEYMRRGLVNIVGGCCGTTPEHILLLSQRIGHYSPRPIPQASHTTRLSGLDEVIVTPERNFVNIGERTNVAGSAKFARLIREGNFEEALRIAHAQVGAGAQVIDICMDDGLIDGVGTMSRFLRLIGAEPEISRVPIMIDSSSWEVLEAGMRLVQGKCIVNSLSLKEGEQLFLEHARKVRQYGAAMVVMLFDERGQADTYERKIEVAERAYRLLVDDGFPPEDIVFDPNILSVATGIEEHNAYGKAFIDATRYIKTHLPHSKVSGGVSNLSFAFRGNNRVREAMHSAFLYHAIEAGMDMGIVNAQMLQVYSDIEPELLERVEDLILYRRVDAAERLTEYASQIAGTTTIESATDVESWRKGTLNERIAHALQRGITDHIEEDADEALKVLGSPMKVIEELLMPAMEQVGRLFGEGKMFLPQVVKSARVMKRAVEVLTPHLNEGYTYRGAGKVILATVKGDVHDIGKNIVSLVLSCNGYDVTDLGVMVEAERIINTAIAEGANAICLSGLITPSLEEMRHVATLAEERGLRIPIIVGGATTSDMHTAVKIAPLYSGVVINSHNAGHNAKLLADLTGAERVATEQAIRTRQQALREEFESDRKRLIPIVECRKARRRKRVEEIVTPAHTGRLVFPEIDIEQVEPLIDWNFFFTSWGLKGRYPEILDDAKYGAEARELFDNAKKMLEQIRKEKSLTLQGVVGIFPAVSHKEDIIVTDTKGRRHTLPMLRNQTEGEQNLSLADYVVDEREGKSDYIGCFAVTGGVGLRELQAKLRAESDDDYSVIMAKLLADRLTEAFAEAMHSFVRRQMWGYEQGEQLSPEQIIRGEYRGKRMAFGYPASPDHSLKREVFDLLAVGMTTAMKLNESYMIDPEEALCGLIFADAEYFSVGHIDTKQMLDYARRRGITVEQLRKLLPKNVER